MALTFRCEHCGKRLQSEHAPGMPVKCPFCGGIDVLPEDARAVPAGAESSAAEDADGRLDGLVALTFTWALVRDPEPEYRADVQLDRRPDFRPDDRRPRPDREAGRSTRRERQKASNSFQFLPSDSPVPDVARNKLPTIEAIGIGGGGRDVGGPRGFDGGGRGPGGPGNGNGMFPVPHNRDRVVYVIDCSGSMTDSLTYVKHELKHSIDGLDIHQKFHVVFYSEGSPKEMPPRQLVRAIPRNKARAFEFIDGVVASGGTDPSEALRRAFEVRPDLVHLLTDGEFDEGIARLVDRLNRPRGGQRPAAVHTLCFLYQGSKAVQMLQTIARRNGGTYRYIGEDDLVRR